ncbi:Uncharacterized protein PECH_004195 [Penicillium ucsense]|uniref:RRM domain-containing protein n=1 Tax=Penicillium ucsense TaxID=2839758 RepID=A0A8J8WN96_9EURO|nr:Uncharacterized protein PECM_005602 [Penicillium ucsense]KAF7737275.1 Uncharacterized protein PECH_004195 [Penicillium ucsense]
MSYPPPPGLSQTPASLPARPPPSSNGSQSAGYNAFTAFQPRAVASTQSQPQPYRIQSPAVATPPVSTAPYASAAPGYGAYYQTQQPHAHAYQAPQTYQSQPQSYQSGPQYYASNVPQIQNPFGSTPNHNKSQPHRAQNDRQSQVPGVDAETEAQIAQWQSAYANPADELAKPQGPNAGTPSVVSTPIPTPAPQAEPQVTVTRSGGGQQWTDSTLLEWDPAHFRLFVGNLAGEVTDDSLLKAFVRYPSVQKARVIREKRTQKSKGYGFISFSDGDDYFKAAREMQGKYIGSHPILLRRANTEVRPVSVNKNQRKNQGGGAGSGGAGGARGGGTKVKQDGVKKHGKTKGGLKILG